LPVLRLLHIVKKDFQDEEMHFKHPIVALSNISNAHFPVITLDLFMGYLAKPFLLRGLDLHSVE
jgi:hypothetical protein